MIQQMHFNFLRNYQALPKWLPHSCQQCQRLLLSAVFPLILATLKDTELSRPFAQVFYRPTCKGSEWDNSMTKCVCEAGWRGDWAR